MPFIPPRGTIAFNFYLDPAGINIAFPAYIDSVDVSYSPSWDTFQEVGRADQKVLYSRFQKSISLAFKVVAESSSRNTVHVFRDLETLTKVITPRYNGAGYQGNFIIFTIGNIFVKQVGYVTSLEYNWNNTEVTWDVDKQLPHWTTVSMEIQWIGRLMPFEGSKFYRPAIAGEADPPGPNFTDPPTYKRPTPDKITKIEDPVTNTPENRPPNPPRKGLPSPGSSDSFLKQLAYIESSSGKNMGSKDAAYGYYQFMSETWKALNKQTGKNYSLDDRANFEKSTEMARIITEQNRRELERTFGRKIDDSELYAGHFFGTGQAKKFIKAKQSNPNADAVEMFTREAKYNPSIFYDKSGKPRSVSEVNDIFTQKILKARRNT